MYTNTDKKNEQVTFNQIAKHRRILAEKQKALRLFKQNEDEFTDLEYRLQGSPYDYATFAKDHKKIYKQELQVSILAEKKKLKEAKAATCGSPEIFDISTQNQLKNKFVTRLKKIKSSQIYQFGKKRVLTGSQYANKVSLTLKNCSTLLIFKETLNQTKADRKLKFRNACKNRFCPVCQSYQARKYATQMHAEIENKIRSMSSNELKKGRLVHIVLTVKNVDINRVGDIRDAWRLIQKNKNRIFKTKSNPFKVWKHAMWGFWKFETNYNKEKNNFHDHLHLLVWVDGWLDDSDSGWWTSMQRAWVEACSRVGLEAHINGDEAIKGAKVNHLGHVMHFDASDFDNDNFIEEKLNDKLKGATAEEAKYVSKSTNLLEIDDDDLLIKFMLRLRGKQLINGFGGVKLSDDDDDNDGDNVIEETGDAEGEQEVYEVVYRFNGNTNFYQETARFKWSDDKYNAFLLELTYFDIREFIIDTYEQYRERLE